MQAKAQTYKKSFFRRLVFYHLAISMVTAILFCAVWYSSTSGWLFDQNVSYNTQQLEALYKRVSAQHEGLKQTQFRLYTYQLDTAVPIYSFLEEYLEAVHTPSGARLAAIQPQKVALNSYVTSIEQPRANGMMLYMISGRSYSQQDVTVSDLDVDGFPREVCNRVHLSAGEPSRRSTYTVPTFEVGRVSTPVYVYALYDHLRDKDQPFRDIGFVINAYSTANLDGVLGEFLDPLVGEALVLDNRGNVIYDSTRERYGRQYEGFEQVQEHRGGVFTAGGVRTTTLYNESFGFYVVGVMTNREILARSTGLFQVILQVAIGACILTLLLSTLMLRSTAERISGLLEVLFQARTNSKVRAPVRGSQDELDAISQGLNEMLGRIEEHIHQAYQGEIEQKDAQLRQRDAELYALQTQVNPHFLYNTLETIRMKALANGDDDAAMMVKALADSFRNRLRGSSVILLHQEVEACQQLMEIYNIRYDSLIELREELDPAILCCAVPRDLLTPLVENVMIHGLPPGRDPEELEILLSGRREGDDLALELRDNGRGFSEERLRDLNKALERPVIHNNLHVGLVNIHNRIRLVYGEGYGLRVSSPPQGGACVEVRIRALNGEELEELAKGRL